MAEAPHDENFVKAKLGIWCVDGRTTIPIAINPTNGGVMVDTTSVISYTPTNIDPRDQNFQGVLMAQDENGLAKPVNVNSSGAVLITT